MREAFGDTNWAARRQRCTDCCCELRNVVPVGVGGALSWTTGGRAMSNIDREPEPWASEYLIRLLVVAVVLWRPGASG